MVHGFDLVSYADNMKRQRKIATDGRAEGFPERLVATRKERNLTQQALADTVRCALTQLKRYESGADEELRWQFEAVSRFDPEAKKVVKQVLDSMILQQEARRRWSSSTS